MGAKTTSLLYKSRLFGQNSDVSDHSEFDYPKERKKKEKRGGHMIKCLLTELGRAGRENIWHSVAALGPYPITSGQIFSRPALPLSQ